MASLSIMNWDVARLTGPENEDWRVPVSELEIRQNLFSSRLLAEGIESAWIDDPVELYWLTGGRQNSVMLIGAKDSGIENRHWVRQSLERAFFEAGGENSPHIIEKHPRMNELEKSLESLGCTQRPSLLLSKIPYQRWSFINSKFGNLSGDVKDCTNLIYNLREIKSDWEISMHKESGEINQRMFEVIRDRGGEGDTEIKIAAMADEISRTAGFGGRIRMRKWPMDCDRVVIAAGGSGAVPSYFDSAIGGLGASPISALGAGFAKVKKNEPVLVDIVHLHRGYVSDCTRIFTSGKLSSEWIQRLSDMEEISKAVTKSLGNGENCSKSWNIGNSMAIEMGHSNNLMGMQPNQAKFLGHSVGLELDETPVVAEGFDRPLEIGGTMAIEPKVIYKDGAIGIEDTWHRTENGMICLTMGDKFPAITEW